MIFQTNLMSFFVIFSIVLACDLLLHLVAKMISTEQSLGIKLHIDIPTIKNIQKQNSEVVDGTVMILSQWRNTCDKNPNITLCKALTELGRNDIVLKVKDHTKVPYS